MSAAEKQTGPAPDDKLWKVGDVAKFLNVSKSWVYGKVDKGELKALNICGVMRFDPAEIRAMGRETMGNVIPIGSR